MMFTAEPRPYSAAIALIQALKDAGIESAITAGGVSIYPKHHEIETAANICKAQGCALKAGYTSHQERFLIERANAFDAVANTTLNSQAVLEEWL